VGYSTLKALAGTMVQEWRDYISAAGQVVSVASYLVWRTRTYYQLKELRETLVSMDRVKMAVGAGLGALDVAKLDADWKMKAVRSPGVRLEKVYALKDLREEEDWNLNLKKIDLSKL
jgi:hypothetical protein